MSASISSREVNRLIRSRIWPLLRDAGFSRFNSRNAWRSNEEAISVINFQSFNAYLATGLRCTTFSFALNLGVYYTAIHRVPWAMQWPYLYKIQPEQPQESACHARSHPHRTIKQPELSRRDIWFVRSDGSNLDLAIDDALNVVTQIALPWMEKFNNLDDVLALYQVPRAAGREEQVSPIGTLAAAQVASAIAFERKQYALAASFWHAVMEGKYYARMPDVLAQANSIISQIENPSP